MVTFLFYVFATVAVGSAIGLVLSRNPVGSLLFMVSTLASLSGIFVLMEAHFLAAVQIIVYAGAIMVLFLFVIMLLNLGHDYKQDLKGGFGALLSFVVAGCLAGVLALRLGGASTEMQSMAGAQEIQAAIAEHGAVGAIAQPLYTDWVVPFEITGVLLLVAVVGALVLAKRHAT